MQKILLQLIKTLKHSPARYKSCHQLKLTIFFYL